MDPIQKEEPVNQRKEDMIDGSEKIVNSYGNNPLGKSEKILLKNTSSQSWTRKHDVNMNSFPIRHDTIKLRRGCTEARDTDDNMSVSSLPSSR